MSWKAPTAVFLAATMVKLLLLPAYKSTDFEVHRNWLAITHSLPISKWYYENTSEWTLDYPPFFAWFEWSLSHIASLVDPLIVRIDSLYYDADSCLRFQRVSVMLSDLTLLYAVYQYCRYHEVKSQDKNLASVRSLVLSLLVLFNYGLLIVDLKDIHFQYNGFLFGILLLSVTRMLQGRCLEAALLFAVLLNLKHIFLYMAPAYFVYLLKHYCFVQSPSQTGSPRHSPKTSNFSLKNFTKLGMIVVAVFTFSFGPFIYMGQLGQVLSRLFPFKRGLCHAYWAPNVWALYSAVDKIVSIAGTKLGLLQGVGVAGGSMTSGLVGEMQLQSLPSVPPLVTMVATLLAMMPALAKLWFRPSRPLDFLKVLILCSYSSFLFGWHVHEKAVIMIVLPMCLLVIEEERFVRLFILLSMTAHVSLFPLLHQTAETPIKVVLFLLCTVLTCTTLQSILSYPVFDSAAPPPPEDVVSPMERRMSSFEEHTEEELNSEVDEEDSFVKNLPTQQPTVKVPSLPSSSSLKLCGSLAACLSPIQLVFVCMLLLIQFYCLFVHGGFGFLNRLEFLPLMLTSVSCALGVVWSWLLFYYEILFS